MPIGVFGEVLGTTGSLDGLPDSVKNFASKVAAPKNPKVMRTEKEELLLSPSQYIFQMSLDTQQKLATQHEVRWPKKQKLLDMGETSYQKESVLLTGNHQFTEIPIEEAIFQPFPSEIFFQNFKANEQIEIPLTLKNNDKVPRLVKVVQAESPYFRTISPPNVSHKVSSGLSLTFRIVFLPDEEKDYEHELVVVTERERFVLPVRAIGPRAVLDFPDEINFSNSPVNCSSKRTILVRNVGNRDAKFSLSCDLPWSVSPLSGSLKQNEHMQVEVEFSPTSLGDQLSTLFVNYDTGDVTGTRLCGVAEEVNIRLEKTTQRFEPTYIGRTSYKQITLTNRSNIIANFKWSNFPDHQSEEAEKSRLCQSVDRDAKVGADRLLEEVEMDPTLKDKLAILYRTFENRKRNIHADPLVFTDDVVKMEPSQGVLWPNSSIDIYVVFKPQEATSYNRTVYCAVDGRADRIALNVRGEGIGPKVQLSFEQMSLGQIFINSEHSYELVLANKGDIDAIFNIVPKDNASQFADCFQFSPFDGIVTPGGHQAILVTFRSKILGMFRQEFLIQVDGSTQKLSVTFEGTVVGPTFHFDVPVLNFGTVSYGFPAQLRCTLENTSLIAMQYSLNVPSDVGTGKPWIATDLEEDQDSPRSRFARERGREFDLQPSQGRIAAMSKQVIDVNFVPNQIRKYEVELTVSIHGVGRDVVTLPILAKCVVPEVKLVRRVLEFGRCFLNYEYTKDLELHNATSLPAKFEVMTQQVAQAFAGTRKRSAVSWKADTYESEADMDARPDTEELQVDMGSSERSDSVAIDEAADHGNVFYHTTTCVGIIGPQSTVRIPMTVRVLGKEEQEAEVLIKIFGSNSPPLASRLVCYAEGPVVNVEPNYIDFGNIEVLTNTPKMVTLANESLIEAEFTVRITRPKSVFHVTPTSGTIVPQQSTTLVITANLDDCLEFEDRLEITVTNGHHRSVLLKAKGFGSTIMIEPMLSPQMEIGPFFSNTRIEQVYRMTNRGRRHQQLVWTNEQYPSYLRIKAPKASGVPGTLGNPIFTLNPIRASLEPGESSEMTLRCYVDRPQRVTETLLCHAIIGRQGGKELIKRIELSADFIKPLVELSCQELRFEVEKRPLDNLAVMRDSLVVKNVSILPLQVTAHLVHPFSLVVAASQNAGDADQTRTLLVKEHSFMLECQASATLTVLFDPAYKTDCHTRVLDELLKFTYEGHPHQDSVRLHSAVHFPNVSFDSEVIDFGCILNYTEQVRSVRMTNSSRLPVKYRWSFLVQGAEAGAATFVFKRNHARAPPVQMQFNDAQADSADEGLGQEAPTFDADVLISLPDASTARSEAETQREARINPRLQQLLARDSEPITLGVEEIFDIMPLFGELQPGEAEDIQFSFFAHADISCSVKALCSVEGGPVYELAMTGQASMLQYEFDRRSIDLGCLQFDQTAQAQFSLRNTGSVPFNFIALDLAEAGGVLQSGQLAMYPHNGYVEANGEQVLSLKLLPGKPGKYLHRFKIQVAHFEPELIEVRAEAVFPSITLDLPRFDDANDRYYSLLRQACASLQLEWSDDKDKVMDTTLAAAMAAAEQANDSQAKRLLLQQQQSQIESLMGYKSARESMLEKYAGVMEVQREVERLAVIAYIDDQKRDTARATTQNGAVSSSSDRVADNQRSRNGPGNQRRGKQMTPKRPQLPDYVLDFGCVILGTVKTFVVRATNTGFFAASFEIEKKLIANSGFSVDLQTVRDLPGYPEHETISFVVSCDPRGANLGVGQIDVPAVLNILNGPQITIRLRANVVMPTIRASNDTVDFEDVKCGECKIVTIQLWNPEPVACDWSVLYERQLTQSARRAKNAAKFIPLHLKKQFIEAKMREQLEEELQGRIFEVMPPAGVLAAKQRINVQIKFTPKEDKNYTERITFRITQSSVRCLVVCRGKGEEPHLQFDPLQLEFGPTLPHCTSEDKVVVVKNPCKFPIEFYNLEYDKTYLEEEKILRTLPGYDEFKSLLLPPRSPGDKLPQEIVDFYEEQLRKFRELDMAAPNGLQAETSHLSDIADMQSLTDQTSTLAQTANTGNTNKVVQSPTHMTQREARERDRDRESSVLDKDNFNAAAITHRDAGSNLGQSPSPSAGIVDKYVSGSTAVGELEMTPVTASIARYLGIDLTPDGRAAHNRRGIAVIVHGYPQTGKTSTSVLLARRYSAALLTIDQIVIEALANSQSAAAAKAREICVEAGSKFAEQQRQMTADQPGGNQNDPDGITSDDVAHQKGKTDKTAVKHKEHAKAPTENLEDSQSVKLAPPIARRISLVNIGIDDGVMSAILPEDVVVDIVSERLQLSDCLKGVIFDGLDTLFCANTLVAFQCLLRALNNRKHLYLVYLKQDYTQMKERERVEREQEARKQQEAQDEERRRLEEMSEDEYAALPEDQRAQIDARQLKLKKERLRREMERKQELARIREQQELEARRLEEERIRRKGKKLPPTVMQKTLKPSGKESVMLISKPTNLLQPGVGPTGGFSDRPESHLSVDLAAKEDDKKKKIGKDGKRSKTDEDVIEEEHSPDLDVDLKMQQKFKTLEYECKMIVDTAQYWDRTTLQVKRTSSPIEGEHDQEAHAGAGRKTQKGGKGGAEKDDRKEKTSHEKDRLLKSRDSVMLESKISFDMASHRGDEQPPAPPAPPVVSLLFEKQSSDVLAPIPPVAFTPVDENATGLSLFVLDCSYVERNSSLQLLNLDKLPHPDAVLDGIGIGPNGPPIPPPATFSVVNYPEKRVAPTLDRFEYYSFIAASPDDPNCRPTRSAKEIEEEVVTDKEKKQDRLTPTKTAAAGSTKRVAAEKKSSDKAEKGEKGRSRSPVGTRKTGASDSRESRLAGRDPQQLIEEAIAPVSEVDGSTAQKLQRFRWTVPPGGEVRICLRFYSEEVGHVDQTFNFELTGTRKRYQLHCRGVCSFPMINKEPRVLFRSRKRTKTTYEVVNKKFILATETFEFGPLLVGKSRDKYKEGRYPENMEKLTISNTSPLAADVSFCFYQDSRSDTFILDPPSMTLAAGESQELSVWAYPKAAGRIEDTLVCCIRENPEPVLIKIACDGVRPELQFDTKVVNFEKVLLHRKETRSIFIRNPTLLPVFWKAAGVDSLGEDFTVSQEQGTIEGRSEFILHVYYRAMKPAKQNPKRGFRIEVYDADNIMGIVQSETIQVLAEAYDVALDMSFQKGDTGGVDFHTVRAFDDARQIIILKNRGSYDIEYRFEVESRIPSLNDSYRDLRTYFNVQPARGTLAASDRPTNITVSFKCDREMELVDEPVIKVYVIEPNINSGKETVACIPIRISVKSLFSKYVITPSSDINFGFVTINTRKSRTFVIENKGEFEFKYVVQRFVPRLAEAHSQVGANPILGAPSRNKAVASKEKSAAARAPDATATASTMQAAGGAELRMTAKGTIGQNAVQVVNPVFAQFTTKRVEARQDQPLQQKLQLGMFNVYPAFGVIGPGQLVTVTVDCVAETGGKCEEVLGIEITDRNPADQPEGIQYKLFVESCVPNLNHTDYHSIFEEHRVCKNLNSWQLYRNLKLSLIGLYAEEENRFVFESVLIGGKAHARFKISNGSKVPCDIVCTLRPTRIKSAAGFTPATTKAAQNALPADIFDVEPQRLNIQAHASQFVTVTFSPNAMQAYSAMFEAAVDNLPGNVAKPKSIQFDLHGEGTLPRVCIVKPTLRNKRGQHLLQFRRMLVGRSEVLPLVLLNDGTLPCKVDIDLVDPDSSFSLQPADEDTASRKALLRTANVRIAHTASILLDIGDRIEFDVVFRPMATRFSQAQLQITVVNNQYEDTIVQLVGEGYEDDVIFENINRVLLPTYYAQLTSSMPPTQATTAPTPTNGARSTTPPQLAASTASQHAEDAALLASLEEEAAAAKSNHVFFGDCHLKEQITKCFTMVNRGRNCVRFHFPDNDPRFKFSPTVGHLHAGLSKDVKLTFSSDVAFTVIEHPIVCKVVQIVFEGGADSVPDWDDRQQVVKWVNITARLHEDTESVDTNGPITTARIGKRKQIVSEPEPHFTELSDTVRTLELLVSVNCGLAKYECKVDGIILKDTPLLETLVYSFSLKNIGSVLLDYNWHLQLFDTPNAASIPFVVEPTHGQIFPEREETIKLKFAPLDVGAYNAKLVCTMPNVDPKQPSSFEIPISARALLPYVHFELDESDYLSAGRRPANQRGPGGLPPGTRLDPGTRCVEFQSIGLGDKAKRSFAVINPTTRQYSFEWKEMMDENEANNIKQRRQFSCYPTTGFLEAGRKLQVMFDYCPSQYGISESFWQFRVPELDLTVPFLLVGDTHEPLMTFDRPHLRFKPLLIGHEASETVYLINSESRDFNFEFVPNSLIAPGEGVSLKVLPKTGTIRANSRMPIEMRFKPNSDKELSFKVACKVKNKPLPVTINVKCEGYKIDCDLLIETGNAQWQQLLPQSQRVLEPVKDGVQFDVTEIQLAPFELGEIELQEDCSRQLAIVNLGKFNFDFRWELKALPGAKKNIETLMRQYLRIEPETGYVKVDERFSCTVTFKPLTKVLFGNNVQLRMHVTSGPVYTTTLVGSVVEPQIEFSWSKWDFGACYIYKPSMPVQQTSLEIRNLDTKPVSVHSLYTPTAHLRVLFEPTVLPPGQSVTVPVQFFPKEAIKYHEQVRFELNSLTQRTIEIIGQGAEIRVETVNPLQRLVDFGAMRIGETYKKQVPIVNRSLAPLTFRLVCTPSNSDLKDAAFDWKPQKEITLQPNEENKVELTLTPRKRMAQFCEELLVECFGNSTPVLAVQGCCHGVELQLDANAIAFGAVVQKCQLTRKLIMNNTGDIGASFKWDAQRFRPDFSIEPEQGYLAPGMQVVFDVTFAPLEISNDVRYSNLKCFVEGGDPLQLTLTGMCIAVQPLKETLTFSNVVRQKEVKALHLINRTNQLWTLRPVIEGVYWTGPETFVVEPMQTKQYELTYKPLTMTADGKKHTGSVFFALPDGTGLLYNLVGQADAPKPINKISREIPSKVHYTEMLQVFNWLKKPQRFRAKIELIKPERLDLGMSIKGLDYVDVPGNGKRDYKLNFFAHKETMQLFKVTFINEQTGEYQFYELAFKIGRPAAIQSIVLTTTVRQSAPGSIKLENPLSQQVAFQCSSTSSEVLMPSQFVIPPNSEGTFNFEYFALKPGETQAKLELGCNELGLYTYDLTLKAVPGGTEPALHFNTPLGTAHIQSARFVHYARQKVDYICKVDHPEFHVEKSVTAAPVGAGGAEIAVDVTYEPSSLGEVRGTLMISSNVGGEYQFPLFGLCTQPKPQGPFVIKAGSTSAISIRNVFPQPTAFLFQVDNPAFHLPKNTETIKPKKEYKLMVAFDGTASGEKGYVMAKLVVSCARSTGQAVQGGQSQNVQWVYYLKGVAQ